MKAKINLSNIMSYLVGNFRYAIYDNGWSWLIRQHILEQIAWRIKVMKKECYHLGSCVECGCSTTALQMANKACDGLCYPTMMDRWQWRKFKKGGIHYDIMLDLFWQLDYGELIKFKTIAERDELVNRTQRVRES
jgi:hypothetical protein